MNPSDEIKSKLDIVDVLREYIDLKPAGMNFRTRCPFHNEKTPSFIVSPEKQIWRCFGCGKGGDVLSFVMEMEGLSFVEALRHLAPKAGVILKKASNESASKRNRLLDLLDLSCRYYEKVLEKSNEAAPAREYLAKRGLTQKTIEEWRIGYSPDSWDALLNFLKGRGYGDEEIFQAGLSVRKEKGSGYYDRFRARIMFPIMDPSGNVAAFSARISPEKEATEKTGKYINSPQTLIYDKSKIIYGLHAAKSEIKKNDLAIVVEGQMDVITSHQAGFKNTVASSGTALTAEQVNLVKRFTKNIALAFDSDSAGELALQRGVRETLLGELNAKFIEIPEGKDPDECIKSDPELWRRAVENAKPVIEYFIDKQSAELDMSKAENRRKAAEYVLPFIALLSNAIEKDFWIKKLGQAIDAKEWDLKEQLGKIKVRSFDSPSREPQKPADGTLAPLSKEEKQAELFLAILLQFPQNLEYAINNISTDLLAGEKIRELYKNLALFYNNKGKEILLSNPANISSHFYNEFNQWLIQNLEEQSLVNGIINGNNKPSYSYINNESLSATDLLNKLVLLAEKDFYDFSEEEAHAEMLSISLALKKNYNLNRKKEIERLLYKIENSKEDGQAKEAEIASLMNELKILNDENKKLEATTI